MRLSPSPKSSSEETSAAREQAIAYRDGLLIALLALRPLRRRNLAGLVIGQTLVRTGEGWSIAFGPELTKTHAPLELTWPEALVPMLETYLAVHRPILSALKSRWTGPVGHALWVSSHGSPMTEMALYDQIRKRTDAAFGRPLNPHLFRDAAATTLAIADPQHVRAASPLLGHAGQTTTERHYQQAQSLSAHRHYAKALGGLRVGQGQLVRANGPFFEVKTD